METILLLLALAYLIGTLGLFKLFQKAGKKGWLSFIPIYNLVVITNVIGKQWWLIPLIFIPIIGNVILVFLYLDMINCYKKHNFVQMLIATLFPFLWLPYLGFSKKSYFKPQKQKYYTLLLNSLIIYVLVIAFVSLIRILFIEVYSISTTSMANAFKPGDRVFANKTSFGPRLPITPLSVPDFILNSYYSDVYTDKVSLPYKRLWQIKSISRNDIIVFNYPLGDTVSLKMEAAIDYYYLVREYGREKVNTQKKYFGEIEYRPIDKRIPYVFRCVALPGDTFQIDNGQLIVNGKQIIEPATIQYKFYVKSKVTKINNRILESHGITEVQELEELGTYIMYMTVETKLKFEKQNFIESITRIIKEKGYSNKQIFPFESSTNWNADNMGPFYIPQKEVPLNLTMENIPIYYRLIKTYEKNDIQIADNQIIINGIITNKYIPKMNYYWVMGDNRDNALDSRYWGFLPEDHIIGLVGL